jgi:uncharacterized membrane protein YraQ (UPF0718 family)
MSGASFIFLSLFVQGLPFLLLGALVGGTVTTLFPIEQWIRKLPRHPVPAALIGCGAGLFIPACECMAVPLVRRFLRQGLPLPAALGYLLASPILNPVSLFSTWTAYQFYQPWTVLALRAGGGLLVALTAALVFGRSNPSKTLRGELLLHAEGAAPLPQPFDQPVRPSFRPAGVLARILAAGLHDFWTVIPYYLAGAAAAAALQTWVPFTWFPAPDSLLNIPFLMALAMVLSVCSSADAFIANSMAGFPLAAQLAFLWIGPVLDVKLFLIYQGVFQKKMVLKLALLLIALVAAMAVALQLSGWLHA